MLPGGSRSSASPATARDPVAQHRPATPTRPTSPPAAPPGQTTDNLSSKKTYASAVNPNSGAPLDYIPAQDINGSKCAHLSLSDVEPEIQYWQTAVLCSVLGANPPLDVIQRFIRRIWVDCSIDKIVVVRKGVFLVRFDSIEDKDRVLSHGFYYFNRKPFIVKGWNPDLDLNTDSLTSIPLWIQLPELDIKYWGVSSLSKICSVLGTPLKTDQYTKDKSMLRYARVLVEMPMNGPFPDHVDFFNEANIMMRQEIFYEWLPIRCSHCQMLGHDLSVCRKKPTVRQEWRRVQPATPADPAPAPLSAPAPDPTSVPAPQASPSVQDQPAPPPVHTQLPVPEAPAQSSSRPTPDKDGFTPVQRKKSARPQTRSQSQATQPTAKASPRMPGGRPTHV